MLNLFISVIPERFDWWLYHAGVWIKIKLFCRLTKNWDKILISISAKQEFPPVDEKAKAKIVTIKDATCYGL